MVKRLRFLPFVLSGKLESQVISGRKFDEVDDCEVGYCNLFSTQTKPRMPFVIPGFLISRFFLYEVIYEQLLLPSDYESRSRSYITMF